MIVLVPRSVVGPAAGAFLSSQEAEPPLVSASLSAGLDFWVPGSRVLALEAMGTGLTDVVKVLSSKYRPSTPAGNLWF